MIVVAVALIDCQNSVLIQQRPAGKALATLWEFPGGKVEPGESHRAALARELAEELAIIVAQADLEPFAFTEERRPDSSDLTLLLYLCRRWQGEVVAAHATALAWVAPTDLAGHNLVPLDVALAERLAHQLARQQA
jgi:8-oxo-dGTP diphosphatase